MISQETDTLLSNAVKQIIRRCPGIGRHRDFDDLKHEAWLLLPKVEAEYDKRQGGGDFVPFAVQRLAWRLLDVLRADAWAPHDIKPEHRKSQYATSPVNSTGWDKLLIPGMKEYIEEHPARALIEEDAINGLTSKLKSILPINYQETFELYYTQGMTMMEVANALGVTESRICQRISIVRQLIHERFPNGEGVIAS
jgi:RNA polymerase sigma factor (sigma-70 family)